MDISWSNIDNLEDYFITYLLYTESKTVSQISRIRNISIAEVNDQLIKAKLEIKSANKQKVESSNDVLDKFLKILHSLTNHRHSDVRRITYSAIRKISSPKSKAVLEKGLYDSNPQTRQYCAKALAKVGDDKTVDILQRLIKNKKANEKEYVIRAYNEAILALKYLTEGGEKCYEDV